jgi:hypothetical protein
MSSGGRAPECRGMRLESACSIGLLILSCGLLRYIEILYFSFENLQKFKSSEVTRDSRVVAKSSPKDIPAI